MASTMNVTLLVVALIAAATVLPGTQAAEYVVGDATGWTIPSSANFYSDWATGKNFFVGDSLVFNFATNAHDVATVTEAAFGACDKSNPLNSTLTGPANINLTTIGSHYFICTIQQHCSNGQKLAVINVTAASSGTPTPPGVPSPPPPPPSAPSSASSLAATFSFILMTIASTIFCLF